MNQKDDIPGKVSARDLVLVAIALAMLLVPMFMLKVHPDTAWVYNYLAGGRVIVFWLVGFSALYSIDKFFRKRQGRDMPFIKFKEEE